MGCYQVLIKGKVQGVFFRQSAKDLATELELKGWVRNTPAGHVEMKVCGDDDALKTFVDWCKTGPPQAVVDELEVNEGKEEPFTDFVILKGDRLYRWS